MGDWLCRLGVLPKGKQKRREEFWFYIFISPWIVGFAVFTLGPIIASFVLSTARYQPPEPIRWVGLLQYQTLLHDKIFWISLRVTLYYTLLSLPLGIVFALGLAMLLNQGIPFRSGFRTIYYLPSIIGGVPVALLWQWILNPKFGVLNYLISAAVGPHGLLPLGIQGPDWFFSEAWTIPSYVLMSLWGLGSPMLIYLASLQGVPTVLYDAATIDGANAWHRFRHVTLPMISSAILFMFITGMISSFQVFTQAYVISQGQGGPNYASTFYVLYLFLQGFRHYRLSYASAMAWILFWIILALTILALRVSEGRVYYGGE